MVEHPPNPGCVILTPHDEHPIGRTTGYPAMSIMCPGVPNLAEPPAPAGLSVEVGADAGDGQRYVRLLLDGRGLAWLGPQPQSVIDALVAATSRGPVARDARAGAAALRDFAAEMRLLAGQAPEGEPVGWPWSAYVLAAVKAEEHAGKGFPRPDAPTENADA